MIYLIPFILICFGIYAYDYKHASRNKLLCWLAIYIFLVVIAGLRYRLGGDTVFYVRNFNNTHTITNLSQIDFESSRFAPGFIVLVSLCKSISNEFYVLQLVVAFIVNTSIFYFFKKYSRNPFFSLLLYYVFLYIPFSMEILRESIAVSICLLAWPFFKDSKWIWWYLCALLAFQFHVSASIMFVLPLICVKGIRQIFIFDKRIWIFIATCVVLGATLNALFFKYIEFIALTESAMERAQTYKESSLGGATYNLVGMLSYAIQYVVYPYFALYCIKYKLVKKKNEFNKLIALVIFSGYIAIFTLFIGIVGRFNNYLLPFVFLILSDWIFDGIKIGSKRIKLWFGYWIIIFLPLFVLHSYNHYFSPANKSGSIKFYSLYYPYSSYIDQTEDEGRERAIRYLRKKF